MKTIEEVAALLIENKVAFSYDTSQVIVHNSNVSNDVLYMASYHIKTKELILMDSEYRQVSIKDFIDYFKTAPANRDK